ncbi:MAG: long-chain-acyl-CoA synthetase [Gammaproteobacteria bacterium]|nr:MAG: long-chain-acyl-CoA synthetase [Gammaproteobacteria bacterium]
MSQSDIITLPQVLGKIPSLIRRAPNFIKAGKILNPRNIKLSLGQVISNNAVKYANRPAIYFEERMLTYRDLNQKANQVSHYLLSKGIKKGDVVILSMHNRAEFLVCAVGIAKIGAVASLINTSQTGKVLTHSINLVNPTFAIIGEEQYESFKEVQSKLDLEQDAVSWVSDSNVYVDAGKAPEGCFNLIEEANQCLDSDPAEQQLVTKKDELFYIYTSGTTGMPKASITQHERWLAAHAGFGFVIAGLTADDVFYATLPLYHATGMLVCWGAITAGGAAIVIKRRFSASQFWDDIRRYNCTGFGYVGELCRYLMNQPEKADDANNPVQKIIGNGLRPTIWKEFKTRFDIANIYEFYASSEGNVAFTNIFNMDNTMGFGAGNVAVVKYDKENETTVKNAQGYMVSTDVGEAGLLIGEITKATPFVGYTQKDKTEGAILRNVFKQGDSFYNTGDLVKNIGCKHYQFVDRLGDTFRWKGENVSTTEVENIMSESDEIAESVVYGVEIPHTNGRAGMASITPKTPEVALDYKGLYEMLAKELPPYAVPLFLRIKTTFDTTGTFKYKKSDLKNEGFEAAKVKEPLYVLLPKEKQYQPLTDEIYQKIINNEYRF